MAIVDQYTKFIEQISGDEKAMTLFERVLETTLAQRRATEEFRAYMAPDRELIQSPPVSKNKLSSEPSRRLRPDSLSQRAFRLVADHGKPISTTVLAKELNATEAQVRGALKRFVRGKMITKPRRGLWLRVDAGRMNGKVASAAHAAN
jgi:hypothetical protein